MLYVMQETVDHMSVSTLRQLLLAILQHHPGIMFDALEATESQTPAPAPDHPAPASPHWCICGRCRDMATDLENLCCGLHNCISQRPVSIWQYINIKVETVIPFSILLLCNHNAVSA